MSIGTTEYISGLIDDGDICILDDGRALRLCIEPDEWMDLADFGDCYGFTAWTEKDRCTGRDKPRPDLFDGRAQKLRLRDGSLWWQPPADVEDVSALRRLVLDILEYGMSLYRLELCEGFDAYGKLIVRNYATLGCVEPFTDGDYHAQIVEDLAAELLS